MRDKKQTLLIKNHLLGHRSNTYTIMQNSLMIVIFAYISHAEPDSYRKVLFGTEVSATWRLTSPLQFRYLQAAEGEFPFIAGFGLMLFIRQIVAPICGGAIINEKHILSAAHCADNPDVVSRTGCLCGSGSFARLLLHEYASICFCRKEVGVSWCWLVRRCRNWTLALGIASSSSSSRPIAKNSDHLSRTLYSWG